MGRRTHWLAGLAAVTVLLGALPATADAGRPTGEQRLLVIPLRFDPPFCPSGNARGVGGCPGWINQIVPPRNTAAQLTSLLNSGLNGFYQPATYDQTFFSVTVLANPDSPDGWWPAPTSPEGYAMNGRNFVGTAPDRDAVMTHLPTAIRRGVISEEFAFAHDRFAVINNVNFRAGQASGQDFPITYPVTRPSDNGVERLRMTSAVFWEDTNDSRLLSVIRHELAHELGAQDLYSFTSPCPYSPFGETAGPENGSGQADCVGPWDTMAFDLAGTQFSAWTRIRMGWMDGRSPAVLQIGPRSNFSGQVDLAPLEQSPAEAGGKPSVLRLSQFTTDRSQPFRGIEVECRKQFNGDEALPEEGLLVKYVDELLVGPKVYVSRPPGEGINTATFQPGQTYSNPLFRTDITYTEETQDRGCRLFVGYNSSPPRIDAAVLSFATRLILRGNATDEGAERAPVFSAGDLVVDSPKGGFKGAPKQSELPVEDRRNLIDLRVRNVGTDEIDAGKATVRVSQPLTFGSPCAGEEDEAATLVGGAKLKAPRLDEVKPGGTDLLSVPWTPRDDDAATGISVDLGAESDSDPANDGAVSGFAPQTYVKKGSGAPKSDRSRIRVRLDDECAQPAHLDVQPLSLPEGWTFSVKGLDEELFKGQTRNIDITVKPNPKTSAGTRVVIPFALFTDSGFEPVEGDAKSVLPLDHEGRQVIGGVDVIGRVAR